MVNQEPFIEFLQKPENLPVALEVAQHVEALRLHFHQVFWQDIQRELNTRLGNSTFKDLWTIISEGESFDETYRNLKIQVKSIPVSFKDSHLTVCLLQDRAPDYRLQYGLLWANNMRSAPNSNTFQTLLEMSKSKGILAGDQNSWAPALSLLDIYPRSNEFILQYNPKFIKELAENIWGYFTFIEPTLYQLNQELFKSS
jgi:hypothetical protein